VIINQMFAEVVRKIKRPDLISAPEFTELVWDICDKFLDELATHKRDTIMSLVMMQRARKKRRILRAGGARDG